MLGTNYNYGLDFRKILQKYIFVSNFTGLNYFQFSPLKYRLQSLQINNKKVERSNIVTNEGIFHAADYFFAFFFGDLPMADCNFLSACCFLSLSGLLSCCCS